MAIIDCVMWAPNGGTTIYAHRHPETNLSTVTQLVVHESQEAVLFSKGQLMGKFGPGKHTLHTENLPILRSLYGIPFGGKNPFTAEVWYVNKVQVFNIGWSFSNMSIHDSDYQTMLPLTAGGQYGLKIIDAEKFLVKVVGTKQDYTEHDMTRQFQGEFTSKAKSAILKFMDMNHVGFKRISAYLDDLSEHLRTQMAPFWSDLGLELTRFYVSDIDIDTSTSEGRKVKDAMARQSAQSITGHTWQQEQMFNTANNAIDGMTSGGGMNSTGGLLGGLMAINMMGGMGGGGGAVGASMMNPQYQQPTFGGNGAPQPMNGGAQGQQPQMPQAVKMVYCSNCAKKFPSNQQFCPNCGNKYNPCPNCGTDNPQGAKRCVGCGTPMTQQNSCTGCGTPLPQGMAFCPNCGKPAAGVDAAANCPRCGAPFPPGAKFCTRCGNKR